MPHRILLQYRRDCVILNLVVEEAFDRRFGRGCNTAASTTSGKRQESKRSMGSRKTDTAPAFSASDGGAKFRRSVIESVETTAVCGAQNSTNVSAEALPMAA